MCEGGNGEGDDEAAKVCVVAEHLTVRIEPEGRQHEDHDRG
jgi:hypothetical protein